MITSKALRQVLEAAQRSEDEGPCFCLDEDCEYGHDEPDRFPSHCVTFVNADGSLDVRENKEYLAHPWGVDGPLDYVTDHPISFPEDAPRMVIIDRATGQWCCATDYL